MTTRLRVLTLLSITGLCVIAEATAAMAQTQWEPNAVVEKNTGGWVYGMAVLVAFAALAMVVLLVIMYMRYAPRFARDDSTMVVHADRVLPGQEAPRRAVDLSQAVPIVVQPPALPSAVAAVATVAAPVAAPALAAEAAAPAAEAAAPAAAPPAPAPAAPAPAVVPAPAPPAERVEVAMDQATFDATLEELLGKGTDRRVAEGQARRAAMIAARKKATGEG